MKLLKFYKIRREAGRGRMEAAIRLLFLFSVIRSKFTLYTFWRMAI
ncbi:hypothetical protein [Chryseobacterium phosphatilyticum]|nr:hypothetical protein [Chryseobacterium phosphatilyticum]